MRWCATSSGSIFARRKAEVARDLRDRRLVRVRWRPAGTTLCLSASARHGDVGRPAPPVVALFGIGVFAASHTKRNPIAKGLEIVAFGALVFVAAWLAAITSRLCLDTERSVSAASAIPSFQTPVTLRNTDEAISACIVISRARKLRFAAPARTVRSATVPIAPSGTL